MAHSCPECGSACYCGGDIDDIEIPDSAAEAGCTCCLGIEETEEVGLDYFDEEPEEGAAR